MRTGLNCDIGRLLTASARRYENYTPNDYSLECLVDENKYFVVSPKDVVSASLYETDDRVKWLIEHE